jgi:glycosyltransferase involved in cell wall biosynthesis
VTTDAPGCRETVEEGVNGLKVPVGDAAALSRAMESFILKPERIPKMGNQSRRLAEAKFNVHEVNRQILTTMGLV